MFSNASVMMFSNASVKVLLNTLQCTGSSCEYVFVFVVAIE